MGLPVIALVLALLVLGLVASVLEVPPDPAVEVASLLEVPLVAVLVVTFVRLLLFPVVPVRPALASFVVFFHERLLLSDLALDLLVVLVEEGVDLGAVGYIAADDDGLPAQIAEDTRKTAEGIVTPKSGGDGDDAK